MASDACHHAGLYLVTIPCADQAALKESLAPNLRDIVSAANPIDLTGSAHDGDVYKATEFCLQRDYIDAVVLLLLPYIPAITPDIGAHVSQLRREYDKPVLVYVRNLDKYKIYIEGFELNGFPVSHSVDAVVRMAPETERQAKDAVLSLKRARLLAGYRGSPAADVDALVRLVVTFSNLVHELHARVESIDLNPVLCGPDGSLIADARIMLP